VTIFLRRRLFLQGAGASLVLPLLPSLLPRTAQAQTARPVRYVQVMNVYGPNERTFFGSRSTSMRPMPNVNVKPLSEIAGDFSPIIGAAFNPLKAKFSVLRGIDTLIANPNHHSCFATCASSYAGGLDGDNYPPVSGQESIDVLLSKSAKVYGASTPLARRLVSLNPVTNDDYSDGRSFSFQRNGNNLQMVSPLRQTQALFDAFSSGFGMSTTTTDTREVDLMQAVYGDYVRTRDSARISAADKQKLEAYMALVNDVAKSVQPTTSTTTTCAAPTRATESDVEAAITNQFKILAAAMACDLTRVASVTLGMSQGYGARHTEHHAVGAQDGINNPSGLVQDLKAIGNRVARLISIFDSVADGSGTLLDNSIIYWSQQYGIVKPSGEHEPDNMPVVVAGKAGGALRQGNYIDFRNEGSSGESRGLPMNNLLVTFMNCMGLSSSDYEKTAGQGYGYYNGNFQDRPGGTTWSATAGRRSALPWFYAGASLG